MKPRGRRSVEMPAVRAALRPASRNSARRALERARDVPPPPPPPPPTKAQPPWCLGPSPSAQAVFAVKAAQEIFQNDRGAADACLGWLFARLPSLGGQGDDMVAHHARLTSERYYEGWSEFCRRLQLFKRDT